MKLFSKQPRKLNVESSEISVKRINNEDYLSLTDMLKSKEGAFFVESWLRNRNTVEFLGTWESMNNPDFNYVEFDAIKSKAGLNSFKMSVKEWVEKTNAIGLRAFTGRYGGTYAHKDIAFEFGTWISPAFKLYLIKDYDRLKEEENNKYKLEWDVRRVLASATYAAQTDAIKEEIVPKVFPWNAKYQYAAEADLVNIAVLGMTASEWRKNNPERAKNGENPRDAASINELLILEEAQIKNASLIREGLDKKTRFDILAEEAARKREALSKIDPNRNLKRINGDFLLGSGE